VLHFSRDAGTDVEMCKSFNLKKTLYDSSTIVQKAQHFAPNTIVAIPRNTAILVLLNIQERFTLLRD